MAKATLVSLLTATVVLAGCATSQGLGAWLPSNPVEASAVFNRRVAERFGVGTSEIDLTNELRRDHFAISDVPKPQGPFQHAAVREGNWWLACNSQWSIAWGAAAGRITAITASYGITACL